MKGKQSLDLWKNQVTVDFVNDRERMVDRIKKKYGLTSQNVLSVMLQVPRHIFVESKASIAYSDGPVPIGFGQTMSQPYTVAFMTNLLKLTGGEKVLEIGTGSGYQAAVLSRLAKEVYTIEIVPELAKSAAETLNKLGVKNVHIKKGSGEWGWIEHSPFDAIIVTAGVEKEVPKVLIDQLKIGGILVVPIGPRDLQTMTRFTKKEGERLTKEEFQKYVFVPFVSEKK